jgi:hypothetical protein
VLDAGEQLCRELRAEVVMSDERAIEQVRKMIAQRDLMAQEDAKRLGCPPPDWVGKDSDSGYFQCAKR